METLQIEISWWRKTLHKWYSFYSLLMYGWPTAFPKQNPFRDSPALRTGLVPNHLLEMANLGFVKR